MDTHPFDRGFKCDCFDSLYDGANCDVDRSDGCDAPEQVKIPRGEAYEAAVGFNPGDSRDSLGSCQHFEPYVSKKYRLNLRTGNSTCDRRDSATVETALLRIDAHFNATDADIGTGSCNKVEHLDWGCSTTEPDCVKTVAFGQPFIVPRLELDVDFLGEPYAMRLNGDNETKALKRALLTGIPGVNGSVGVRYTPEGAPREVLIHSRLGHVVGDFNAECNLNYTYNITMYATFSTGRRFPMETVRINVQYRDDDPFWKGAYGPGNMGCVHGSVIDEVPFDKHFDCSCDSGWTGANCDKELKESGGASPATVAILVVLFAVVVPLLAYGVWQHRQPERLVPIDFRAKADALFAEGRITAHTLRRDAGLQDSVIPVPREIPRRFVTTTDKLGSGNFGDVFKGVLDALEGVGGGEHECLVAIKTVKDSANSVAVNDLCEEAMLMAGLTPHPNVAALIGVVTLGEPLMLVLGYYEHGALHSYLRKHAEGPTPNPATLQEKLGFAMDVARGMHHLEECRVVHRDLAARNCLVDTKRAARVADFGLSRLTKQSDYYQMSKRDSAGNLVGLQRQLGRPRRGTRQRVAGLE